MRILCTSIALALLAAAPQAYSASPHWTYETGDASDGQDHWAEIIDATSTAPAPLNYPYAECGIGQKQSPVNVTTPLSTGSVLNDLTTRYNTNPLVVENNGHTIKVNESTTAPGKLYFGNIAGFDEYTLLQYHIHAPSEHTLNGNSYRMEIHFVHGTTDGKLAVVGVVVVPGAYNDELQKILDNAPATVGTHTPANVWITPANLIPSTKNFVSYAGSLTTPPCTEGVSWYVLAAPLQASEAQLKAFEAFYADNARKTQGLNGRVVNFK